MATVRHIGNFPWCLPQTRIDGFEWASFGSIKASMALFWRVKAFRVAAILSDGINSEVCGAIFRRKAQSEKELVCEQPFESAGSYEIENFGEGFSANLVSFEPRWTDGANVFWDVSISGGSGFYRDGWELRSNVPSPGIGFGGSSTLLVDDLPLEFSVPQYGEEAPKLPSIDVEEYWPYDPADGLGPIYNDVTGRQLRPFPG